MTQKVQKTQKTYCGYIAIIGRPNVGKSTLLNTLLGKKLSITSQKAQTTRHRILGIKTQESHQMIFIDTPGLHAPKKQFKLLNQQLNKTAIASLKDADSIVWVLEATRFTEEDSLIFEKLKKFYLKQKSSKPLFIVLNKTDKLDNQNKLLSFIEKLSQACEGFSVAPEFVPISAQHNHNVHKLEELMQEKLPESPFYFESHALTDRGLDFIAAEMIREKLVRFLGQELPYATTVSIQSLQQRTTVRKMPLLHISAVIWVEKEGQKKIVIGERGLKLKQIGEQARKSLEKYTDQKVFLQLWVKVKSNWSENAVLLKQLLQ